MDKKGTVRRLFVLMGGYRWLEIVSMATVAASAAMNLFAYVRVYYVGEAVLTTAGDLSSIDRQAIAALGWDAVLFIMAAFGNNYKNKIKCKWLSSSKRQFINTISTKYSYI